MREMEVREGKTRPAMRMIGHTTYLTFARKSLDTVKVSIVRREEDEN